MESSLDMAEYENVSTLEADKWLLAPIMAHDLYAFLNSSLKDNPLICQNCVICPYSSFHYFQEIMYSTTPKRWGLNVC